MQPDAEPGVGNRQRFMIDDVFRYLAQHERHCDENDDARHEMQTRKSFFVNHAYLGQTFLSAHLSFFTTRVFGFKKGQAGMPALGPAVRRVTKLLRSRKFKMLVLRFPFETLNFDVRPINTHDVE